MWDRAGRFWGKLLLISFAIGVVTGIVQEFQFGMNWSEYSRFVGDIFGAPLAMEGLVAFFLESTFLGLWIFGRDLLSPKIHLATIWCAAIGSAISAYFILAANSWMQHPVGYRINPVTGQPELTSIWKVLTNSTQLVTFSHTLLAAMLTGGAMLLSVSAWHLYRSGVPALRSAAFGTIGAGVIAAVTVAAVVASGVQAVGAGAASPIMLGVLAAASLVAFDTLGTLPAAFAALGRCGAGLRRVKEVLDTPVPVPEPLHPIGAPRHLTGVTAAGFTLAPALDALPVLVATDLDIAAGARVGVVGPSGSGKSSLLAALLRLLPTADGQLTLRHSGGSVAVVDLRPGDLPPLVAGSLQGDHVFATTLRDNLRVVAPATSDAELDGLAERVGLAEWVRGLPEGWSTQAGADGNQLSGGQRQRLLLARALLANPQVLVLDEPTAHLDAVTEALVMADINRCTAGRTLVLSTHRHELLDGFDQEMGIVAAALQSRQPVGSEPQMPYGEPRVCAAIRRPVTCAGMIRTKRG